MNSQITKYDLSIIKNLTKGNLEMYNKMINVFINNSTNEFRNLEDAIILKDIITIKATIHKLKPSLEYLMLKKFSDEISIMKEKLDKSENYNIARAEFHTLNKMLSLINSNLQNEIIDAD